MLSLLRQCFPSLNDLYTNLAVFAVTKLLFVQEFLKTTYILKFKFKLFDQGHFVMYVIS